MAADDAVSLLRSLKAAGEKTGAVEAEGALHLRRNSRRTMDGFHALDAVGVLQGGCPAAALPAPKFPAAAAAVPTAGPGPSTTSSSGSGSCPVLMPCISFSSNSIAVPIPAASSPGSCTAGLSLSPQGGITLAPTGSVSGCLPVIASTASSPSASPSRLSVRPPTPLTSLPSPTSCSAGGAGAGTGSSIAAGSAATAVPALAASCGPPSPQGHSPSHLSPGMTRRAIHALSSNGSAYDAVQLPHTHGSPLPLIFDPPVSIPSPTAAASSPTGGGGGIPVGVSSPGSPGTRQVQFSSAVAALSPSGLSASLPSIASVGGGGGGGGLPTPPAAPAPMPSLLPSSSRAVSARSSMGGAPSSLVIAAAGGGGGGGGGSPLGRSLPIANSPSATGSNSPAGGGTASGRPLRPPPGPGTPFGLSQAAAAAAPPSPGSPSASSPVVPGVSGPSPRSAALESAHSSVSLPLASGAAQAALQLQLQTAATVPPTLQQQLQNHNHHLHKSARPSSARSIAGGTVPEGLSGTLSSRRLSMTGAFESSQKLVLAAAHELSSLQQQQQQQQQQQAQHHHQQQQQPQQQSQQQQQQLQQLLPPPQLAAPRLSTTSSRGSSVSVTGSAGAGGGGGSGSAVALPRVAPRDARASDPGTFGGTAATAMAAAAPATEFGFPTPEPLPPQLACRLSLAPLPVGALQAASRASTPPAASSSSGLGWPLAAHAPPASPQLGLRSARPEPLPQRPEPPQPPGVTASGAVSTPLPEALQPRQEPLPPLPAAAGAAAAAVPPPPPVVSSVTAAAVQLAPPGMPLVRAGTLAPLGLPEEPVALGAGPVAESTLDSTTPDLDPAALFGPGSGSGSGFRGGFMELTVRSIAAGGGGAAAAAAADKFAVQSSVRQRLQTDPLRFHPPAAGGGRRPGQLDPLEATPRLVLAGGAGGGGIPPLRQQLSGGRPDIPKTGAAVSDTLWAPNQDILPHMVSRASSGGGAGGGGSVAGGRLGFHPATSPTGAAALPPTGSPLSLIPSTPSLELPTPRLRTNSGAGGAITGDCATGPPPLASEKAQSQPQQHRGPAGGALQSSYLKALAAAAGLEDGGGPGYGGVRLQRQRSLSDSGCGGPVSFLAAAADSGPVGLPLEGGLAVLGGDMWSRVRAERNHNTRYNCASAEEEAGGEFGGTLDDTAAFRAAGGVAAVGMLPPVGDPRVGGAGSPGTPAPGAPGREPYSSFPTHPASPRRNLSSSSSIPATPSRSCGGAPAQERGSTVTTHGSGHVCLDASVSSLPLKALRLGPGGAAGNGAADSAAPSGGAATTQP